MARISPELLQADYEKYMGMKYFLKHKENNFWSEMNFKYKFTKEEQPDRDDHAAYLFIKENYTKEIMKRE